MADFTVAAGVNPPAKIDPLALVGSLQGLQKGSLTNKLLGQEIQGKIALGHAVTSATDPETGRTDWDKAAGLLAQDPDGSFQVPEFTAQAQARRLSELQLTQEQVKTTMAKLGPASDLALSLIAGSDKTPLTSQNILGAMKSNLVDTGLFNMNDPHDAHSLSSIAGQLTDDPKQNQRVLERLWYQMHSTTEGLNAIKGAPQMQDVGPALVPTRISPATGEVTTGTPLEKARTPSEKAGLVSVYNPQTKAMELHPSGEIIGDSGPSAQHPQTAPAMGEQSTAESNVQQAQVLQKRAAIVPQRKAALSEMVGTLNNFTPGPKANLTGTINGLAAQFGIPVSGSTTGKAAQDTFNKLAAQIALDQWGSLGGTGSNEQLATAVHANPNETMSKMGIKNVAALLQGNEDAIGAQFSAWQKFKAVHGVSSYDKFQEGWNRYYDPRVFQAAHMTPAARKEMLGGMTADERKTFSRDENIAQQAGWLSK